MAPTETARWWEAEPPPCGPSEVNKYIDRCLDFFLAPQPDAPARRIVAQSFSEDSIAEARCDNCDSPMQRISRVRNPFCTSHAFHLCPACWPRSNS